MSVDSRPTGTYDGPRGPAVRFGEQSKRAMTTDDDDLYAQALKEIITRDMGELSASDKDAVKKVRPASHAPRLERE